MAKTNFSYEKRQRELEKKRKAEAKNHPGGEAQEFAAEASDDAEVSADAQETQAP